MARKHCSLPPHRSSAGIWQPFFERAPNVHCQSNQPRRSWRYFFKKPVAVCGVQQRSDNNHTHVYCWTWCGGDQGLHMCREASELGMCRSGWGILTALGPVYCVHQMIRVCCPSYRSSRNSVTRSEHTVTSSCNEVRAHCWTNVCGSCTSCTKLTNPNGQDGRTAYKAS